MEPQGSFSSPSLDVKISLFKYELYLPENIGKLVGEGELAIYVETKENSSFFAPTPKFHTHDLNKEKFNASAAEEFCFDRRGHLASIGSLGENEEVIKVAEGHKVWLGGRRTVGGVAWGWLDGRPWTFEVF